MPYPEFRTTCSGTSTGNGWRRSRSRQDQSIHGAFHEMRDQSEADCREIVEEAAAAPGEPGSAAQLIGDLYASFMDEATVEARGSEPAWQHLRELDAVDDVAGFARPARPTAAGRGFRPVRLRRRHRRGQPGQVHGGLLPGRHRPARRVLLPRGPVRRDPDGLPQARVDDARRWPGSTDAERRADSAIALETEIAAGHWDRVRSRDSSQTYNPMDRAGLDAVAARRTLGRLARRVGGARSECSTRSSSGSRRSSPQ